MAALADRARAYAQAPQVELARPLGGGQAWSSGEATTVRGRGARREAYPTGPGDDAALPVPQGLSVGGGAPVRDHVSSVRAHDSRPLSLRRPRAGRPAARRSGLCRPRPPPGLRSPSVPVPAHRTDTWKPPVAPLARRQVAQACSRCQRRLADNRLRRDGRAMDADVPVGPGPQALPRRLVGGARPRRRWRPHESATPARPTAGGGPLAGALGGRPQPPVGHVGEPPRRD